MKRTLLNLIFLLLATMFVLPLGVVAGTSADITWHGYLVDADSAKLANKVGNALDFVQSYDRTAALNEKALAAGYKLFADKWYQLDKQGNELAIEVIRHSIKKKGFYVTIEGKLKDNTIVVKRLVEVMDTPF